MNLARKRKVLGFAVATGFLVAMSATMPAEGESTVGGSDLVGSYSGEFHVTPRAKLASSINLTITEVVGDDVKGTFLFVPGSSGRGSGTCRDVTVPIVGTLQEKHLNLVVPADDKNCHGVTLDLVMKEGRLEGAFIPHFNPDVQIVLKRK